MTKYFVCSDLHLNHENIIGYCDRPFGNVQEMNEVLIANWNNTVRPEDTVFLLGDFCLASKETIVELGNRLNGRKILITGNHDRGTKTTYQEAGFESVFKEEVILNLGEKGTIIFSHHPKPSPHYLNIHGHTHSVNKFDTNNKNNICVSVEAIDYTPIDLDILLKQHKTFIEQ